MIQGLTEFLPVSSDGHLALAEILFGVAGAGLTLNVLLHAGTLIATAVVLRARVLPALVEGLKALGAPRRFVTEPGGRDALTVLCTTVPTGVIGLTLHDPVERWTHSPLVIGIGFLLTAALLLSTRWAAEGDLEQPSVLGALLIGVFQGLAVLPGLSRSGSTVAIALWLGVRRDRAFELSMLMSLPPVLGAVLLEARKMGAGGTSVAQAAVGALVAFVVGMGALVLLRRVVVKGHFWAFALWVLPLAFATLAMARAWP